MFAFVFYDPAADITHGVLTLQLLPFYFFTVFQPAEFAINAACLPGYVPGRKRKRPVSLQPICPRWLNVRFIRVKVQVWHWKTQVFERKQALRHQARAGVILIHPPALCLCVGFKRQEPQPLLLLYTFHISVNHLCWSPAPLSERARGRRRRACENWGAAEKHSCFLIVSVAAVRADSIAS